MRACLVVLSLLIALASASFAVAGEPPVPIEGMILVSAYDMASGTYSYFIEGTSDNVTPALAVFPFGKVSPHMDRVTYQLADAWPATTCDVWTAR